METLGNMIINIDPRIDHFIGYYKLADHPEPRQALMMIYFAFTSLSTVGLGDFCPKGEAEMILCSMLLLFGVAIFSYIMGMFIDMIDQLQELHKDLDDADNLSKFFGVLQNFNNNKPIDPDMKHNIEEYFKFKWRLDRGQAFVLKQDIDLLMELPEETKHKLFGEFLYKDFICAFQKFFTFQKFYS